jgi:hypothetical protein
MREYVQWFNRGAFSDAVLDHEAIGYLLPLWTERLAPRTRRHARFSPNTAARSRASRARSLARTPPGARSSTTFMSHKG